MSNQEIPQFDSLGEFVYWYLKDGIKITNVHSPEVFLSDDATSISLFRSGRFQAELYLLHQDAVIPEHSHPGVKHIERGFSGDNMFINQTASDFDAMAAGDEVVHGADLRERAERNGYMILSLQEWSEGLEVSTISSRWKGRTAGPKHEAIIKRFNPDCVLYTGYADVTKKQEKLEII